MAKQFNQWGREDSLTKRDTQLEMRKKIQRLYKMPKLPTAKDVERLLARVERYNERGLI